MRWINRHHRGFNRVWIVFSCLLVFPIISYYALIGGYKVFIYDYVNDYRRVKVYSDFDFYRSFYRSDEYKIKERVHERWREKRTRIQILDEVRRSMREAKSFTDIELNAIVRNAIEYETEYQAALKALPQKRWMA